MSLLVDLATEERIRRERQKLAVATSRYISYSCTATSFDSCGRNLHQADKVKLSLEQTTKTQRGEQIIAYPSFNFGVRWRWVVSTTRRLLYPPGKTRYPLYRRLGGPHGRSGRVRRISPPTGIRSPDRPACSE